MRKCNCGGEPFVGQTNSGSYYIRCKQCRRYCGLYHTVEFTKRNWNIMLDEEWEDTNETM